VDASKIRQWSSLFGSFFRQARAKNAPERSNYSMADSRVKTIRRSGPDMSKVAQLVGRPKIGLDESLSTGNSDQPEHLSVGPILPTRAWSILTVKNVASYCRCCRNFAIKHIRFRAELAFKLID